MNRYRREYALGTYTDAIAPWGLYVAGKAICSDGIVRSLSRISQTADTFFSVPATVKARGKTISGYVTVETVEGYSTETDNDPAVLKFVAYQYGKNGNVLPNGAYRSEGI
jgi:hypothetical protein